MMSSNGVVNKLEVVFAEGGTRVDGQQEHGAGSSSTPRCLCGMLENECRFRRRRWRCHWPERSRSDDATLVLFNRHWLTQSWLLQLTVAIMILMALFARPTCAARCSFPDEWKGQYFQSGLGNVIIRKSLVTTKGTCIDQHRDYFLFANREHNCFQCLLMMPRHHNVIQYKESYCLSPDSLKNICAQIRVETPLFILVRDPVTPIPCPFQDAYYFNYNDAQHSLCDQSLSYAKPCVGSNKYQFHFKHCQATASLHGKDFDVECLATWKDGSESYMYSRVTATGLTNKDEQYRCFNYQHLGSEVFMSMSADATCRGLRNAHDGQYVLELTKDAFGWPIPTCRFPDWLKNITWRDTEGRQTYSLNDKNDVMSEYFAKKSTSSSSTRQMLTIEMKCVDVLQRVDKDITIRSFSVIGCMSKYQCLRFRYRSSNVVEFYKGALMDVDTNSRCTFADQYQVILSDKVAGVMTSCPGSGEYQTTTRDGCATKMRVGCRNDSNIDVISGCGGRGATEDTFECLTAWQADDKRYVIVRDLAPDNQRLSNIFTLSLNNQRPAAIELDRSPGRDLPPIASSLVGLTFTKLGSCGVHVDIPPVDRSNQQTSSGIGSNLPQYQFVTTPSPKSSTSATRVDGSPDFRPESNDFRLHRSPEYDDEDNDARESDEDTAAASSALGDSDYDVVEVATSAGSASSSTSRRPKPPLVVDIYSVSSKNVDGESFVNGRNDAGNVPIGPEAVPPYKSGRSNVEGRLRPKYYETSLSGSADHEDDEDDDYSDSGHDSPYRSDERRPALSSGSAVWSLPGLQHQQQAASSSSSSTGSGSKQREPVRPLHVGSDISRSGSTGTLWRRRQRRDVIEVVGHVTLALASLVSCRRAVA